MKTVKLFTVLILSSLLGVRCSESEVISPADLDPASEVMAKNVNNGAPSGAHYNLNIIGVPKEKTADMTNGKGHRIFVPLTGHTKIWLSEGPYEVLDANGTDGSASFQLPNPDPDNLGITEYSVYARALGKPGGTSTINFKLSNLKNIDTIILILSINYLYISKYHL